MKVPKGYTLLAKYGSQGEHIWTAHRSDQWAGPERESYEAAWADANQHAKENPRVEPVPVKNFSCGSGPLV